MKMDKLLGAQRTVLTSAFALVIAVIPAHSQTKAVVFWQSGFPTVASQPIDQTSLTQALNGMDVQYADLKSLGDPATLAGAGLLILPYGSAVPTDAWKTIQDYLHAGGNLLVAGGQPLRVPVTETNGKFIASAAQDTYTGVFDNSYEVPVPAGARFAWRDGYDFPATPQIHARRFYAVEGRPLDGLGYMVGGDGLRIAAPVIVADYFSGPRNGSDFPDPMYGSRSSGPINGSRVVALDFEPEPGYWQSADGIALLRQAARYASWGATQFTIEALYSAIEPGGMANLTVHVRESRPKSVEAVAPKKPAGQREVKVTLKYGDKVVDSTTMPVPDASSADLPVSFHLPSQPGLYGVSAELLEGGQLREGYENGIWAAEMTSLNAGPALGVHGNFLTRGNAPFFPVGTNYFSTEDFYSNYTWNFSDPRNAWVWDRDFADMERQGVTFVRTGDWFSNAGFIDPKTGGVNERFLRNVEAFLLSAQHHNIAVNFNFFHAAPQSGAFAITRHRVAADEPGPASPAPPNPYLNSDAVQAEQAYVRSVVERFKDVPWLTWDLINEPSFSNPRQVFHGNIPNGDPIELTDWREWLRRKYNVHLAALAEAWSVSPEQLGGSFNAVPLPSARDFATAPPGPRGNADEVRALDYNLFAQDMFSNWVRSMITLIRATGSQQLIDVGQDEGGVTNRVLNQFYGGAGVSFTTNHTYWQSDALLWDSIAAKRPGVPNITGETGYRPVHALDGAWRYDEFTSLGIMERKWALGFAAGSSGYLQWDWGRDTDLGIERSDGSAKVWENVMRGLDEFASRAAPSATALKLPDVAIVLPQSLQMSAANGLAIKAQQNAVRALYGYARGVAYAVGEYQPELLGNPKLILLLSPMGLTTSAWSAIEERVRAGAVLLVTGPFGGDAHMHDTGREDTVGLPYRVEPLKMRDDSIHFPGGDLQLAFPGADTTVLNRAVLPGGEGWKEQPLGKGKILFAALPLELNDNLQAIGEVYSYAMKVAGVAPIYTTTLHDPGILICPTQFPDATLYVITSESNRQQVNFTDARSGKQFTGKLASGRAAILLVGTQGKLLASYNWPSP